MELLAARCLSDENKMNGENQKTLRISVPNAKRVLPKKKGHAYHRGMMKHYYRQNVIS